MERIIYLVVRVKVETSLSEEEALNNFQMETAYAFSGTDEIELLDTEIVDGSLTHPQTD
jgi:hypothetical protein